MTPSVTLSRSGQIFHNQEEYDISEDENQIYRRAALDAFTSVGLLYKWNDRWSSTFNVRGKIPLTNLYNNNYKLIDKNILLGAQIGVRYKL